MRSNPELDRVLDGLTADRISAILERAKWTRYGGREGLFSRWKSIDGDSRVLVPLNPENDDFDDLMRQAVYSFADAIGDPLLAIRVLDSRIRRDDEIKFRKDVPTIAGAVSWPVGHSIVQAAQDALLAAAKSRIARRAYYGKTSGHFAHRFLDSCLMGQTEIGSYVVTAFAPADEYFPEKEPRADTPALQIAGYTGREISNALVGALQATSEAIDHYTNAASLAGFVDGVSQGVSREMAAAVRSLVLDSEGAEIKVEWAPGLPAQQEAAADPVTVEFRGSAAPILERAISRLASLTPSARVRINGWVRVVARPRRGEPGLITVRVVSGSDASTVKVRLTQEQFEVATQAIAEERGLAVSGRQEREGRTHWLYDAADLELLEPVQATTEARSQPLAQVDQDPLPPF